MPTKSNNIGGRGGKRPGAVRKKTAVKDKYEEGKSNNTLPIFFCKNLCIRFRDRIIKSIQAPSRSFDNPRMEEQIYILYFDE